MRNWSPWQRWIWWLALLLAAGLALKGAFSAIS
jgi:hypothetical protein